MDKVLGDLKVLDAQLASLEVQFKDAQTQLYQSTLYQLTQDLAAQMHVVKEARNVIHADLRKIEQLRGFREYNPRPFAVYSTSPTIKGVVGLYGHANFTRHQCPPCMVKVEVDKYACQADGHIACIYPVQDIDRSNHDDHAGYDKCPNVLDVQTEIRTYVRNNFRKLDKEVTDEYRGKRFYKCVVPIFAFVSKPMHMT